MTHLQKTSALQFGLVYHNVEHLKPDPRNARKHPASQLARLEASIAEFGFTAPVLIDEHRQVIAGHARIEAAKALGLEKLPCVVLHHLSRAQKQALALADNRIAELALWDTEILRSTLEELINIDFSVETTGFSTAEIDVLFEAPGAQGETADPDDDISGIDVGTPPVSRPGDLWVLGKHRLLCGNSLEEACYIRLLGSELADLICADAPYNLGIAGNVSGLGRVKHGEFAMASGEMAIEEFSDFLTKAFELGARFSMDGSIHFQFMDWRHMREMLCAGYRVFSELKALCIWNKQTGGMGSLYRSQHELVFVWKSGRAPHINNVELGKNGRYRTNVWDVRGMNSFHAERDEQLAIHPTVKPVGLIADAIRDCSKVGGLVLDPFGGSGTTILAADRTRRRAALIEIDPRYVDVAIRRWEKKTRGNAVLASSGRTFAEVEKERAAVGETTSGSEAGHD